MRIKLSTGIMQAINVGMYETQLDPRYMFESEDLEIDECDALTDEEKTLFFNADFKSDEYDKVVVEAAVNELKDFLVDVEDWTEVKITLCDGATIDSPQFYNYRSDELDFEVEVEQSELDKILPSVIDNQKFWEWIEDRYGSCSGFISFCPYRKDEFIKAIQGEDIERSLAMWLTWIFKENVSETYYNPYEENMIEYIRKYKKNPLLITM